MHITLDLQTDAMVGQNRPLLENTVCEADNDPKYSALPRPILYPWNPFLSLSAINKCNKKIKK